MRVHWILLLASGLVCGQSPAAEKFLPKEGGQDVVGDLTAYYIKNIRLKEDGKGNKIALTNLDGLRVEYWLENGE